MITGYDVKPCPRCRAGQAFLHLQSKPPYVVRCGRCGALGPVTQSPDDAVTGWNSMHNERRKK